MLEFSTTSLEKRLCLKTLGNTNQIHLFITGIEPESIYGKHTYDNHYELTHFSLYLDTSHKSNKIKCEGNNLTQKQINDTK